MSSFIKTQISTDISQCEHCINKQATSMNENDAETFSYVVLSDKKFWRGDDCFYFVIFFYFIQLVSFSVTFVGISSFAGGGSFTLSGNSTS